MNFFYLFLASFLASAGELSKVFSDSTGPDGKINWPLVGIGLLGVIIAALKVTFEKKATTPEPTGRTKEGGFAHPRALLGMLIAGIIAWALFFGLAVKARAAEASPQFGGCFAGGELCAAPAVAVTVGQFNLATSKFSGGVSPGIGYGITYRPGEWYATGLAGYLAFHVGGSDPSGAVPSFMLSFANWVRVGAGVSVTERPSGPMLTQWLFLFGLGTDFGGSPSYLSNAAKAARGSKTFSTEDAQ